MPCTKLINARLGGYTSVSNLIYAEVMISAFSSSISFWIRDGRHKPTKQRPKNSARACSEISEKWS
jgi:hypothetical protein